MSDFAPLPPEDDALAAEYVLGLLDTAERATAERRRRVEPAFAAAVTAWENRLSPLNAGFDEVPVRNLLPAIEARLFPVAEQPRRRWFAPFAGALTAAALAVAIIAVLPPPVPEVAPLTASLAAEGQALAFSARIDPADGTLTLIRTGGAPAEAGQDLQLWVIGADGVPASLGLIREAESTRPAAGLTPGQVLAVSLEPAGGSPTGQPTGPVLVTGVIAEG
jgi:anti-sigma-K factor RskA